MLNSTRHEIYPIHDINVKIPSIAGILTLISKINTKSESTYAREVFNFQHFSFYEGVEISCSFELSTIFL